MDTTTKYARTPFMLMMAIGLALAALGLLLMIGLASATITGDLPPASGDWNINHPTTVTNAVVKIVDGNITVNSKLSITGSTINIDWMMRFDNYDFIVSASGSVQAKSSNITSRWGNGIHYDLKGPAGFDTCNLRYALDGIQIHSSSVSFLNSTIGPCINMGVHIVACDPDFDTVEIDVPFGTSIVKKTTDQQWGWQDPLRIAAPMGLWVDGGTPTFTGVTVQVSNQAEFDLEYTGTDGAVTEVVYAVPAPVLIDSPTISVVSGIKVENSNINVYMNAMATAPGINPQTFTIELYVTSVGIMVLNYVNVTITDVEVTNTYLNWPGLSVSGGSNSNNGYIDNMMELKIGAIIAKEYTSAVSSASVTLRDISTSEGEYLFTHAYWPGYSGIGNPTFNDKVLVSGLDVSTMGYGPVINIQTGSSYVGVRTMTWDFEVTGCSFADTMGTAIVYSPSAGPGINPGQRVVNIIDGFKVDNCTFTSNNMNGNSFIQMDGVWENHMSDQWTNHVELADNSFSDCLDASGFNIYGVERFAPGTEEIRVINNVFQNMVIEPGSWGHLFEVEYFESVEFLGNTFSQCTFPYQSYIEDFGGDSNGVKADRFLFDGNTFTNCSSFYASTFLQIYFGGNVLFSNNQITECNGFLSFWQEPEVAGPCGFRMTQNDMGMNTGPVVYYARADDEQKELTLRIDNNTVHESSAYFIDYEPNSQIDTSDNDGVIVIEDNDIRANTAGCIHAWGDVRLLNNKFTNNEGPLARIDYINLHPPTLAGNILAGNVNAFEFVAKDRGYQLVSMRMSDIKIDCTGRALLFVNMEITMQRVEIDNAEEAIVAQNSLVDAYESVIDGSRCSVVADGRITTWWPVEVMVTWGDADGTDSGSPAPGALVVFYDASDSYYSSANAGDDGVLAQAYYPGWRVDLDGMFSYSPYTIKVASSGAANEEQHTIGSVLTGSDRIHIVLLDTFKPVVAITDPAEGAILGKDHFTAHGFVAEIGSGVRTVEWSRDGGVNWIPLTLTDTGDFAISPSGLPDGDLTVMVRAVDNAGNVNSTSVKVTIDTIPPNVTISTPISGSITNISAITVTGATEPGVRMFVNGIPQDVQADGTISVPLTLNEGMNVIVVEAMDAAGNTATVTTNITLDTFPPVLVLTAPADSLLTRDGSVTVRGIVERGAMLTIGGTVVVPDADGSFSKSVNLIQGKTTVTVVATDEAGNRNVQVRTVTMDNMPPAVKILEPTDGTKVTTSQVLVRITADSDARLYLNGRLLPTKGAVNRTVLLEEGPNLILVRAVDPAGNEGTASVNVILDTRAPTLEITKPSVMEVWTDQATIEVDGSARNGATGVIVNGVAATFDASSGDFCQTVSQLTPGENNITVVATDGVNEVRQTIKVWLSVARPTLVVDSLSAVITTPTVTITGRTDPGIKTVTVKYSGLTFTFDVNYDGTFAIKLNMPDGPHTVDLSVTDVYGNTATQSTTPFTVKALKIEGKEEAKGFSVQPMGIAAIIAVIGITLAIVAWMVIRATRRD